MSLDITMREISNGALTGTGGLTLTQGFLIGGILVNADGTNAATVTIQEVNSAGKTLFSYTSKQPQFIRGPFRSNSQTLYYSVSGTNASLEVFEAQV